ncbi:flagellar brake protein [Gottfriedia luciferensis]|uniref:flagellar brake protein n=1 Tax=Gottfriedia luciferensis TaxID=178774 RepID=UPI001302D457|nr:PilZ domain-containing protein [Gottfriedia luciferensis]
MLSIGDTVYIEEIVDDQVNYYKSRLVDLLDHSIHLDIPINENTGRNAVFIRETKYKVYFLSKKSTLYTCHLNYISSQKSNIRVLVFEKPDESQLVIEQRRKFFRIASSTEIKVMPMEDEFTPFETLTQDISAGGVAINVSNKISVKVDQIVQLKITLKFGTSIEEVNAESKIVRIQESEIDDKKLISLMFTDLTSQSRQKIIKYTLDQQRAHIQSLNYGK